MKRMLFPIIAGLPFTVGATPRAPVAPSVPGMAAEQMVRARQAAYGLSAGTFAEMKIAMDAGADVKPFQLGALALARWARTLPTLFPDGSNVAPTNARPEVWTDRAGFNQRAEAYAAAATKLAEVARSGDKEAFAAQWSAVRDTCKACHDGFRRSPQN